LEGILDRGQIDDWFGAPLSLAVWDCAGVLCGGDLLGAEG
jgi:hypothetical protein